MNSTLITSTAPAPAVSAALLAVLIPLLAILAQRDKASEDELARQGLVAKAAEDEQARRALRKKYAGALAAREAAMRLAAQEQEQVEALLELTALLDRRLARQASLVAREHAAATEVWVAEHRARAARMVELERSKARATTRASERHAAAADATNDLVKARASIARLRAAAKRSAPARRCWSPLDPEFMSGRDPADMLAALELAQSGLLERIDALEVVKRQFHLVPGQEPRESPRRSARLRAKAGPRRSLRLAARAQVE